MSYFYKSGREPSSFKPSLGLIALFLIVPAPKLCAVPQATPQVSGNGNAVENANSSVFVQYEQWKFPWVASGLQKNVTTSVQFSYWPLFRRADLQNLVSNEKNLTLFILSLVWGFGIARIALPYCVDCD